MSKVEAIAFDADGTLLSTFEHIVQAFEQVLPEHGIEPNREEIAAVIGMTLLQCYETLAPDIDAAVAVKQHHTLQQTPEMYELISSYDGMADMLEGLKERDIRRVAVTNRSRESLDLIFNHLGIVADDIEHTITPDDLSQPKPHPEGLQVAARKTGVPVASFVMVGDTAIDIETGKNAGIVTIGVTHGFGTRESLEAAGADYIVDGLPQILPIIDKINGYDAQTS